MVRVGVIGVGNMGSHHARILSSLPGAELAGVCDADRTRAEAVALRNDTRAFTTPADLLASVEAVVVAVPTEQHAEVGSQALAAGCHVLMEKPLAHDLPAARALCEQAGRAGRLIMTGYVERFNPAVARLKELLPGEELLYLSFTRVGPEPPRSGSTGVILDLAIHDLDLLTHLSGQAVVRTVALAAGNGRQDTASLSFLLSGGGLAHVTANWLTPYKVREVQAATPSHLYRCDLIRQQLTAYSRLPEGSYAVHEIPIQAREPLRAELTAFVDAVAAGAAEAPVPCTAGLASLALVAECIAAAG
ncbi:MAG TPA: Gfo/Idh/MocA family oxidoreductase [Symbiobacteriaceae bacterium]|jgi:predicted dehydrogenase